MKKDKLSFVRRLSVLPFVLGIHIISYLWCAFSHTYRFVRYGGEWINYYQKGPTIKDVYEEVKHQLIFTKITAEAIKDFNKLKTEPALTKQDLIKAMSNFGGQFQHTVCDIFDKAENIKHFGTK